MKQGLDLDRVVLLGRTLEEYVRFFGLNLDELGSKAILDVAAGVSSFTAEARARGLEVTAFDRIYQFPAEELRRHCEHDLEEVTRSIGDKPVYLWDFYKTPEGMRAYRQRAYTTFLADFEKHSECYVAGELPRTKFKDGEFDFSLASYLLFVYEDQFNYEFHRQSILELMRITKGEIRIYPTVTFEADPSKHLERMRNDPDFRSWNFEIVPTDFEFLRNSNCYLKMTRKETFSDHFSSLAAKYANFRPNYPPELFDFLAGAAPRRGVVWECGCGSGQASVDLAERFERVIATDASSDQIKAATQHPNIEYRVAPAEKSGLPDASVDLIAVAQAMHWFDLERFYAEVKRVLKRDGLLAVWIYGASHVDDPAIDALMQDYHYNRIGPHWPPERQFVEEGYASLPFPFRREPAPPFSMSIQWTLDQLIGYYSSWSGTKRYVEANGENPLVRLREEMARHWGDPNTKRAVRWPLTLILGQLPD